MRTSRHWKWITLLVICLALPLQAADEQPRYDIKKIEIFSEIIAADNKIDALADLHLTLLDKTNFIILRLNGNLTVTSISDETGEPLRFIQEDTERFEVMINFGRPQDAETEKIISIQYNGIFPRAEFDFLQELGTSLYSYIGNDMVELYASAFWFPTGMNPMDRAKYEIQITLPPGCRTAQDLHLQGRRARPASISFGGTLSGGRIGN